MESVQQDTVQQTTETLTRRQMFGVMARRMLFAGTGAILAAYAAKGRRAYATNLNGNGSVTGGGVICDCTRTETTCICVVPPPPR